MICEVVGDAFGQGGGDRVLGHFRPGFNIVRGNQVNRVLITAHVSVKARLS